LFALQHEVLPMGYTRVNPKMVISWSYFIKRKWSFVDNSKLAELPTKYKLLVGRLLPGKLPISVD